MKTPRLNQIVRHPEGMDSLGAIHLGIVIEIDNEKQRVRIEWADKLTWMSFKKAQSYLTPIIQCPCREMLITDCAGECGKEIAK